MSTGELVLLAGVVLTAAGALCILIGGTILHQRKTRIVHTIEKEYR